MEIYRTWLKVRHYRDTYSISSEEALELAIRDIESEQDQLTITLPLKACQRPKQAPPGSFSGRNGGTIYVVEN